MHFMMRMGLGGGEKRELNNSRDDIRAEYSDYYIYWAKETKLTAQIYKKKIKNH
jgi:hypothetical protein